MPIPRSQGVARRSLLRDDAYRALRDAIVNLTFAPGERLHEPDLIQWLGVSRTPIREALARLEQAGLVQSKPGRSTIVSPLDVRETKNAQAVAAAMHELAVRDATPLFIQEDFAAMTLANARFAQALKANDVEAALQADDDFHDVAVSACHNETARGVLEQVTPMLRRLERIRFYSLTGRGSVAQHRKIIALSAAGQADEAAVVCRQNWLTLAPLLDTESADLQEI